MDMFNNIDSINANIWGKCTDSQQKMIKHIKKSTMKQNEKDIIWLLKNLKTVSTGIESMGNKRVNYFDALKYFINMRQGPLEGDDGYIKRSRSAIETSILAGGCHTLCSSDIMETADQDNPLEK